jgi:NADH-quinone oxidoreductase subunit A
MYWPFWIYLLMVLALAGAMVTLSFVLGQRRRDVTSQRPYESGIPPVRTATGRTSVQFYLVALFFVIFDVESVFLFAWASAIREAGWAGYIEVLVFVGVLMAGLAYLWKRGALDWGRR